MLLHDFLDFHAREYGMKLLPNLSKRKWRRRNQMLPWHNINRVKVGRL